MLESFLINLQAWRDSNTDVFQWILQNLWEHLVWMTSENGCFWERTFKELRFWIKLDNVIFKLFWFIKDFKAGICISRPPTLCWDPGPGLDPGRRPWPTVCIYRPWSPICVYRPWPSICVYRPWPPICIYRSWSLRSLGLHIPTLSPQFVFTGPNLRFFYCALILHLLSYL